MYSHLDTSLSGAPRWDRFVVGDAPRLERLHRLDDVVTGPGVAVAKGPVATATIGFVNAVDRLRGSGCPHDVTLLLAAGGTHRALPPDADLDPDTPAAEAGLGVRRFLARRRPDAAIVAKAGPAGVLHEEPGQAYVVLRVHGDFAPVLSRRQRLPDGGLPTAIGAAVAGVESWADTYRARPTKPGCQVARDAAVGSVRCGLPYKADLIGGLLELYVYVILGPGDDPVRLGAQLTARVRRSLAAVGRTHRVTADVLHSVASARSDPHGRVVAAARRAWRAIYDTAPPPVGEWKGTTDGVLFRHAGVTTARLGPSPVEHPDGEALRWSDLVCWSRLYEEVILEWARGSDDAEDAVLDRS
jgi:acetylornithine deacetylase/succinyl-diaminopimelate desuccinylase-like protein